MHVSIIVPLFNEVAELPRLVANLDAVLAATAPHTADVLLVDGGSDDGTRELLASTGHRWIATRRGRGRQLDAGAAATRGDVLLFLHADTRLPDGALAAVGGAAVAGAAGGFFALRLDSDARMHRIIGALIRFRSRWTGISTGDQAQWVRRDVFGRIGGFGDLALFEDLDLARRLRRRYRPVELGPAVLTSPRRWSSQGTWSTIARMWTLRLLYWLGVPAARLAPHYEDIR